MKKPIFEIHKKPLEKQVEVLSWFVLEKNNCDGLLEYLNINSKEFYSKDLVERKEILKNKVEEIYKKEENQFDTKIIKFKESLSKNTEYILNEFAKIFDIKYEGEEIYRIEVGISPICPRYLDSKSFDLSVEFFGDYPLQVILHEMTHFYWFEKFKQIFPKVKREEYESPNLVWVLSEIVVDPIIKNSGLKRFLVNNPAYDIFYETLIFGENLIEKFNEIYKNSKDIESFIKESMNFVNLNKTYFENLANNC